MNRILRRALGAAAFTAAAAAGTYVARKFVDRQRIRRGRAEERLDVSRWEGEGGAPPDLAAAAPHHDVATH